LVPILRGTLHGVAPSLCTPPPKAVSFKATIALNPTCVWYQVNRLPVITLTVYPYECDAYGHLNAAAWVQLFERARWEMLGHGPGVDLFQRHGVWPAVRKATVEYHLAALPGDVLAIHTETVRVGRTSLELRQRAVRAADGALLAETHHHFVMIDREGRSTPVPDDVAAFFGPPARSTRSPEMVRHEVGAVTLSVDIRGDGPALLLVHGFPLDRTIWMHQVATLSGWRRIAPDLRGLGDADAPEGGYSMAAYADDLVRLLDKLRVTKAVVAGLSMGGYVAFEMLRRYRDRIAGLILCDTKAEADTPEGKKGRDELAELARTKGPAAVAERMVPKLLGRSTRQTQPPLVQRVTEMIARAPVPGIVGALEAMRDRPDSAPLLPTITVPTLVVVGQEDEVTPPAGARAMANAIPNAALTTIAGAGHVSPLEAPTAVSRVMAEFLEAVREG
jgi:3-oxoadipate enol-lactonase